jgi:hypothetical protein
MKKFQEIISDNTNASLKRRAAQISTSAEIAQQNLVNALKQEKTNIELKIAGLTDLAPDTTDSLRPGSKDWDAVKWVKDLQTAKQELYQIDIQLKLAQETFDEYFTENADTDKK